MPNATTMPTATPIATPIATTEDALLGRQVAYRQPARGYRVALEAPLLARFALPVRPENARAPFRHVVDLGAGPGAVALMLVVLGWGGRATAVEPDPMHARLAAENAECNGVSARFSVLQLGVTELAARGGARLAADLVIANPPWFDPAHGAVSPEEPRGSARTLRGVSIDAFVRAARAAMGRGGRFVVSFPASRLLALCVALEEVGLVPKRLRFVHPRAGREAQVAFVEAKPGRPGGLVLEAPLFVRCAPGAAGDGVTRGSEEYTPEAADTLAGRWPPAPAAFRHSLP